VDRKIARQGPSALVPARGRHGTGAGLVVSGLMPNRFLPGEWRLEGAFPGSAANQSSALADGLFDCSPDAGLSGKPTRAIPEGPGQGAVVSMIARDRAIGAAKGSGEPTCRTFGAIGWSGTIQRRWIPGLAERSRIPVDRATTGYKANKAGISHLSVPPCSTD
jgi:hypothetical protein